MFFMRLMQLMQCKRFFTHFIGCTHLSEAQLLDALRSPSSLTIVHSLNELGKLKHKGGKITEAISWYLAAQHYSASEEAPYVFQKSVSKLGLSAVFLETKDFDKALIEAQECLAIRLKILPKIHAAVCESRANVGSVLLRLNRIARAIECFEESLTGYLQFFKGNENIDHVIMAYFSLGHAYIAQGETELGISSIIKSRKLAEATWGPGDSRTLALYH
jgi:tetratricopeptide (TPR) repeat protein